MDRNKEKHKDVDSESNKNDEKKFIKSVDCDAKYRFQVKGEKVFLLDHKEDHNHVPNFKVQKTLSTQMRDDIRIFSQFSKPSARREFLEEEN